MEFRISVVIPVYNGERFIKKAIESALLQPEVSEIVVVNDGSTDGTNVILEKLQEQNSKIKIYHHKSKSNQGRSASRNLGIKNAAGKYIAFLDADDFYLSNRFASDKKIFQENNKVDGVYNAIGAHFYREATKAEKEQLELTTIRKKIDSEKLFEALLSIKHGYFHIDGLTVKKPVFKTIGYFSEDLKVAEDTEIFFRMALKCQLEAGIIDKPVAMRGVHENNVNNREDLYDIYRVKMFESLYFWSCKNRVSFKRIESFLEWLWTARYNQNNSLFKDINYWLFLFINNPKALFSLLSIKYFPIIRLRKSLFPFLYSS
jgi:glycosyltransferase involved in cell wall biosynthesis